MCGDLEPDDRLEADLLQRFRVQAAAMLQRPRGGGAASRRLDALFDDLLRRVAAAAEHADGSDDPDAPHGSGGGYRSLGEQSLVLARLAGFVAGHVALQEDPLRKLMEAALLGYQEAESPPERDHHGPGDGHGPGHDHPHGHGHAHAHGHGHGHDQGDGHDHDPCRAAAAAVDRGVRDGHG